MAAETAPAAGESHVLTAGRARVVITSPAGIPLVGFAGRPPSTGIHDDLTATALVLCERHAAAEAAETGEADDVTDDPATRVAIVALDLIGLHGERLMP